MSVLFSLLVTQTLPAPTHLGLSDVNATQDTVETEGHVTVCNIEYTACCEQRSVRQ